MTATIKAKHVPVKALVVDACQHIRDVHFNLHDFSREIVAPVDDSGSGKAVFSSEHGHEDCTAFSLCGCHASVDERD